MVDQPRSYVIPLVDLAEQYRRIQAEVDAAVRDVLASGSYILGRYVAAFEEKFASRCGCRFAVGVNSGTDALELALRALGIGSGDEVIVPALTFMSTALAVTMVGATPVIADIEEVSNGLNPEDVSRRITPRTKVILPVHLHGQPCDMEPILQLAHRHRLRVIEDCAQAVDATLEGRPVGSFGDAGCFSFYPTKNLGAAGDGGAVVTNDQVVAERLRLLRHYGTQDKVVFSSFGRNSRLDELQAAILLVKLKYLEQWTEARRQRAAWYRRTCEQRGVPDVQLPRELAGRRHVYHLFVVRVPERDWMLEQLCRRGIQAMMHYPRPIHLDSPYENHPTKAGDLPHAERVAREILSLPMHPDLSHQDIETVVGHLDELTRQATRRTRAPDENAS